MLQLLMNFMITQNQMNHKHVRHVSFNLILLILFKTVLWVP